MRLQERSLGHFLHLNLLFNDEETKDSSSLESISLANFFPIPRQSLAMCCKRRRRPLKVTYPAFLEQIIPGLMGGMASSLCFYPLEVCETLIQGASAPATTATLPSKRRASLLHKPSLLPQFAHLNGIAVVRKAYFHGYLLKGFDMAVLSAIFGYTAFFALLETGIGGSNGIAVTLRTFVAAAVSFVVNSPFQLLKTAAILADDPIPSHELCRQITADGKNMLNLWHGYLANSLGVLYVSAQWTSYQILEFSSLSTYLFSVTSSPPVDTVICGALATAFAVVITYPASVIRTAIMANRSEKDGEKTFTRLCSVGRQMLQDGTLYNGVLTSVARTIIPSAVFFGIQGLLTT